MDRPECRLQIDNSTNNQSSQLRSTNDFDCCFMTILPLKIKRKLWSNTRERTQGNVEEQGEDSSPKVFEVLLRETARKDYPVLGNVNNPMHLKIMMFVNPESWSSTTEISGYGPQIYPGTFLNTRDEAMNGAQTKLVRVLIGSQLIGTDQTHKNTTWQSHLSWQ